MNWLHYLAEANLYLAVFYLAYCLLLSRETHYQLNRIYLLFSCVAAFALPVLQVGVLKPNMQMVEPPVYAMLSDRVVEAPLQMQIQTVHDANPIEHKVQQITRQPEVKPVQAAIPASKPQLGVADYLWYAYLIGSTISLAVLLVRLTSLLLLTRRAVRTKHGRHTIIQLPGTNVAFSFFNYLFLSDNAPATDTIITHELVHIRQKHSADVIFLELLKIINWFNPCIYLLQNSLKTIHEYIADQYTVSHQTDTHTYATFLVNTAHGVGGSPITHSFFNYNLLKKRIIMLNQKPSVKSARLKYLITAPICAALLCMSTLAFTKDYNWIDLDPAKVSSAVHEIKSAPIISHIIEKVAKPSSPNKNIKTVKVKAIRAIHDAIADHMKLVHTAQEVYARNMAIQTAIPDSLQEALGKFYADLKWYIQYPYSERENNIQGRAIVRFCVDDNGELQYLAVYKTPSFKLGYQVFWAMKHSAFLKPLKGNWALSIAFDMGGLEPETRPITEIKQDTTTKHLHSDPNGTGLKWTIGGATPAFTYDPHNMHGPYKMPVKVLSELVIKAER